MTENVGLGNWLDQPHRVLLIAADPKERQHLLHGLHRVDSSLVLDGASSVADALKHLDEANYDAVLAATAGEDPELTNLIRTLNGEISIILLAESLENLSRGKLDPTGQARFFTRQQVLQNPAELLFEILGDGLKETTKTGPKVIQEPSMPVARQAVLFSKALKDLKDNLYKRSFYRTAARWLAEVGRFNRAFIAQEQTGGRLKIIAVANPTEEIRKLYESNSSLFFAGLENYLTASNLMYPDGEVFRPSWDNEYSDTDRVLVPPPWLRGSELIFPLESGKGSPTALAFLDEPMTPTALDEESLRLVESLAHHISLCFEHREQRLAFGGAEQLRIDLISSFNIMSFSCDSEGKIIQLGPYASTMLGEEPQTLRGRSILEFVAPEDVEVASNLFTSIPEDFSPGSETGTYRHPHTELRFLSAEGEYHFTVARSIVHYKQRRDEPEVTGSEGIIIDLSEHFRHREALKRTSNVLTEIVNHVSVPVICYDHDGQLLVYNKAAEIAFGYTSSDVAEKDWTRLVKPVYRNMVQILAIAQTFSDLAVLHADEWEITCKDGTKKVVEIHCSDVVDADGKPSGVIAIVEDVGTKREMELELVSANVELQAHINELETLVRVGSTISLETSLAELNEKIQADLTSAYPQHRCNVILFDSRGKAASGDKKTEDLIALESAKKDRLTLTELALKRRNSVIISDVEEHPDMKTLHKDSRSALVTPILSPKRIFGVLSMESRNEYAFSTAEQKVLESMAFQLAKAMENIDLQSRLRRRSEEINNVLYAVSIDLKSPLSALGGFLELFRDAVDKKLSPKEQQLLDKFRSNLQYLNRLVSTVSNISSYQDHALRMSPVDIEKAVKNAKVQLFSRIVNEPTPEVRIPNPLPIVTTDELIISRVLLELFSNAYKFRHPKRTLEIEVTAVARPSEIQVHVRDNGEGIEENNIEQVFSPFFTVRPRGQGGIGMGLFEAKTLVEMIGGSIWCRSQPGEGSVFSFTIPIQE